MIRLENISKKYGTLEVLRGVSLDIPDRCVTSVVGPSGAGKTTLLQILGTLDRADTGHIWYDDVDVSGYDDRRLSTFRNASIGFVFQSHCLLPEFTLLENVAMPAMIGGRGRKEAMHAASELLEMLGLSERASHKPAQLSGGEAQRGAVARALVNSPRVVLADEPSGSLDTNNREMLHRLFFDLRDRLGMTFVIVTHDESLAERSDHIIHLVDGRIVRA